jgi:hypothetical protein
MGVQFHSGIGQANSGVTNLITNYQSDSSSAVTNRVSGHQGTDAYQVILSDLALTIQSAEQCSASSAKGRNVYSR